MLVRTEDKNMRRPVSAGGHSITAEQMTGCCVPIMPRDQSEWGEKVLVMVELQFKW